MTAEQPILLTDCPDCGMRMTLVLRAGQAWPTCVCCGGSGLAPDPYCRHHDPQRELALREPEAAE